MGVVSDERKVALLSQPIPIDDGFVEAIRAEGNPELHYRFADKCAKSGCSQWTGTSCGVMNTLTAMNASIDIEGMQLPECAIRPNCRWYDQDGGRACIICPYVVTQAEESSISNTI